MKTVWEVVSDNLDYIEVGQDRDSVAPTSLQFKGPDQQKPAGACPAAKSGPSTWR